MSWVPVVIFVASIVTVAGCMIYEEHKADERRRRRCAKVEVAFVCPRCKGNGLSRSDPDFECKTCNGTGVVKYLENLITFNLDKLPRSSRERFLWKREVKS